MASGQVFFTKCLDSDEMRFCVHKKIMEFIEAARCMKIETVDSTPQDNRGTVSLKSLVHLCLPSGWHSVGNASSITSYVVRVCRLLRLLPSDRSVLLPLSEQYQAIQLCLARRNKEKFGEFMAAASDILDVWHQMFRDTIHGVQWTNGTLNSGTTELSDDPTARDMQQMIACYRDFLSASGAVDQFDLYQILKSQFEVLGSDFEQQLIGKIFVIEGMIGMSPMDRELLKVMLSRFKLFHLSVPLLEAELTSSGSGTMESQLDISGIVENIDDEDEIDAEIGSNEIVGRDIHVKDSDAEVVKESDIITTSQLLNKDTDNYAINAVDESLSDFVDSFPSSPQKRCLSSSDVYVEQLFLAHLRLLVNTRDELALSVACSMPGREITQLHFGDIKSEARRNSMPIYQTILSFVMKLRLGGKGYQPDRDCSLLPIAKPLGEFVDSMMKLQNVMEEATNVCEGAERILMQLKLNLSRLRGGILKRKNFEDTWSVLDAALKRLGKLGHEGKEVKTGQFNFSTLNGSLKLLVSLCDAAGGLPSAQGIVDILGENFLTQMSSAHKNLTPVRIPSVVALFRSPISGSCASPDCDKTESLKVRAMKRNGISLPAKSLPVPQRFQSCCAWAPEGMSPVGQAGDSPGFMSPIVGPTLKMCGKGKVCSVDWKEVAKELEANEEKSSVWETKTIGQTKVICDKVHRSKRSLLEDISNMSASAEVNTKKKKFTPKKETKGNVTKKKCSFKPLLKGQLSITKFFKL